MKKKIAYIEIDTHPEIADAFFRIMKKSTEYTADFFFSQKIHSMLPHIGATVVSSGKDIIKHIESNNYQHVIIGTAHRHFDIWNKIASKFQCSVIVHNKNFSKLNSLQLASKIFKDDWKFRLKLLLKESLLSAPKLHKTVKTKWVLDHALEGKDYTYMPIFYRHIHNEKPQTEHTIIVIPGNVEQTRRDYGRVLDAIKYFRHPTEIVLLGKASGSELAGIDSTLPFLPKHVKLTYFTDRIPKNTFDKYISIADVLWCPIQYETKFFSQIEQYGVTKISGNILDAIKAGKPIILPKHYETSYPLAVHEKEDIETQILQIKQKKWDYTEIEDYSVIKLLEKAIGYKP